MNINDYEGYFWYQVCLRIQALKNYKINLNTGIARSYNLKPEFYNRLDFDTERAYIALNGTIESEIVHISKYDYYTRVNECIMSELSIGDKKAIEYNLCVLADDVLGEFIGRYIDMIVL